MNAIDLLRGIRIVPVVVIDDVDTAVPLAETLLGAGLRAIEVTLRTPAAEACIEHIASGVPGMLLGAGSIRNPQQLAAVTNAGAHFAVCPGAAPGLLDAARAGHLPFIPGAVTPGESLTLLELGFTLQKFFPAEVAGGVRYLESLAGPMPELSFMPTGGITPDNAVDYLALPNVACIGGSWIVPDALLRRRDYAGIAELAVRAAEIGRSK